MTCCASVKNFENGHLQILALLALYHWRAGSRWPWSSWRYWFGGSYDPRPDPDNEVIVSFERIRAALSSTDGRSSAVYSVGGDGTFDESDDAVRIAGQCDKQAELEATIDRADEHTAVLMESIKGLETRLAAAVYVAKVNYDGWQQEMARSRAAQSPVVTADLWQDIATNPFVSAKRYLVIGEQGIPEIGYRIYPQGPWICTCTPTHCQPECEKARQGAAARDSSESLPSYLAS